MLRSSQRRESPHGFFGHPALVSFSLEGTLIWTLNSKILKMIAVGTFAHVVLATVTQLTSLGLGFRVRALGLGSARWGF